MRLYCHSQTINEYFPNCNDTSDTVRYCRQESIRPHRLYAPSKTKCARRAIILMVQRAAVQIYLRVHALTGDNGHRRRTRARL